MLRIERETPLAPLTTLELGGPAAHFARVEHNGDLQVLLREADEPVRVLGGGSNLVIADAGVSGTVARMATRGLALERQGDRAVLTVQAGERWQSVVDLALDENLAGVECLTGIPGSVGATPIQNVGAYGQEVADTLLEVQVLVRATGEVRWLAAADCGFTYRGSVFKRNPGRHVVLAVRFSLIPGGPPRVRYAELARALELREGGAQPDLRAVADAVWSLRAGKSMVIQDTDSNRRSAGSFFTNPIVSGAEAQRVAALARSTGLVENASEVPRFSLADGRVKLAAGWLIERAGFRRGCRRGAIGLSTRHALALVHHGGGSTAQLLELARVIRAAVQARFGVTLQMEPTCWETGLDAG